MKLAGDFSLKRVSPTTFSMTNRYTIAEWLEIIKHAEKNLSSAHVEYKAVSILSEDFARAIDHTLLKIDATKEQIDLLCNEARIHGFKAGDQASNLLRS